MPLMFEPRQQQSDLPELDAHVKEITRKNGNLVIESKVGKVGVMVYIEAVILSNQASTASFLVIFYEYFSICHQFL